MNTPDFEQQVDKGSCLTHEEAKMLLDGGGNIENWEILFADVRNKFAAEAFLDDWRVDDKYELSVVGCMQVQNDNVPVSIEFLTPRLGAAELTGTYVGSELVFYSFLLEELLTIVPDPSL